MHGCVCVMQSATNHCSLTPPSKSAADHTTKAPSSHTRGVGILHLIASANFGALTSQLAVHTILSLKHILYIPLQLESCKSVGLAASWSAGSRTAKSATKGHSQAPDPARASSKVCR
eukprot:1155614-Pelagomonas_calceolata.AAC.1